MTVLLVWALNLGWKVMSCTCGMCLHVNVNVSDTPELNGINTTLAGAEINFKTGGMVIRGTWSFQPEGIAGTWEGSWVFIGTKGNGVSQAVGHGTGALAGKTIFLNLYDAEPDDP